VEGLKKTMKYNSQSLGRDSNPGSLEYDVGHNKAFGRPLSTEL